ncbi:peptidase S24 [Enterobacter sp. CP102]|uniref:peptidase S24 n=1 Tax=Enterobacter sp. CP102 TaxID=2976431 RepID=UPI0021FE7E97|nr:peptidase S24 [Enterobacter sp. CP102]UWM65085.1 peptidase S24 [Enterobacter sp. CP102]
MASPVGPDIPEVGTGRGTINGSLVVTKLIDANEASFTKWVIDGGQRYLKDLIPLWPMIPINGNCKIIGVVVEAREKFI